MIDIIITAVVAFVAGGAVGAFLGVKWFLGGFISKLEQETGEELGSIRSFLSGRS